MSAPWHANFPAGKSNPPEISAAELAALSGPGKEYIVVDVRRTDIDVSVTWRADESITCF